MRCQSSIKKGVRSVLLHNGMMGTGRTFDSSVELAEDGHHELIVKFYILPTSNGPTDTVKNLLDAKVYERVSVKVAAKIIEYTDSETSADGRGYWVFGPEGAQVAHLGIVDMGANFDAVFKTSKK